MARRASASTNPVWFIIVALIALVALIGAYVLKGRVSDPYRTLTAFPVADYMQNSNSLRGNTYKLEAVVGEQLQFSANARLFSVEASGEPVALLVPAALREVNIQKGQRFIFKIEVGDKGVIKALEAKKS